MKKIIGVAFISIATLFLFSCLDALPEEETPITLQGGGREAFTYNGRKLNGFAEGRALGYEDQKGTADGTKNIRSRIWMVDGIIVRATVLTGFETPGYGRELGSINSDGNSVMANLIVKANSADIQIEDLISVSGVADPVLNPDAITTTTPRGGAATMTFNAILEASKQAINKIAELHHVFEGGGTNPWKWDGEPITMESSQITFIGWMPHNSNGKGDPTNVTIKMVDGFITEVTWDGADADCRDPDPDGTGEFTHTSFGGRMLRSLSQYFIKHNRVTLENESEIVDRRGFTIGASDESEYSLYNADDHNKANPDTLTRATGTKEAAIPAAQRAFQTLIINWIEDGHN